MQARLLVIKGKNAGASIEVTAKGAVSIGRGDESSVPMFDPGLSRRHFTLVQDNGGFLITDLKSTNGTYVNSERIGGTQPLHHGDIIAAGSSLFEFRVQEDADNETTQIFLSKESRGESSKEETSVGLDLDKSTIMTLPQSEADMRQAHRALTTLYKIGNLINGEIDLQKVLKSTMDAVMSQIRADRGTLILIDRERGTYEPVVVHTGVDDPATDPTTEVRPYLSRTILDTVVKNGTSIISNDAMGDERFKAGESVIMQHIRSVMCVPLAAKEKILGAIYLDSTGVADAFQQNDLELVTAIALQAGLAIDRAKLIEDLENLFFESIRTIVAALEAKDRYTCGHSERVTTYAVEIARAMDWTEKDLNTLNLSALLHDVGKIGIPERVLLKPGKLTAEEYEIMKQHPVIGAEIIKHLKNAASIIGGIRYHHERWDGMGYPDGLKAEQIPLMARIIQMADSYDAMTSHRPYRKGLTHEEVVSEVERCKGSQFDPKIAEVFLRLVRGGRIRPLLMKQPHYMEHFRVE
ncbi:MAG: HD domain-containing protein [Planctomycetes bacterium]|nr:HD domain-containing protein [Planctomycetota bacterium]